ncbi:GTP-binding protein [Nostoc sp. 'Peltigera membranacea cyanobiont' 213]|uniref:dynamin family protein n=1 Tax=Nostoc cyanobionts TaxID=3123326 RepID=UPI000B956FE0|nr:MULTISPECIES: dynamin family protein [unclassified Nostoc]AVH64056.1 dynamin family protein [Nostoc sp. 'Peltigera membranacea cyanobiont' N6]OYD87211.1 GTP-binding protein [Nostoc sp. 'Peltigera membranacea cyanobiont' 213]
MTLTQTATQHQYELFQKRRGILLSLIQRQLTLLRSLEMKVQEATLEKVEKRVHTETFKVLILGEFKRGKSTFINAMLGDEVLPAYARPCTAIINEVKWGDSKRALLHFSNVGNGTVKPPKEIPIEQIEEYVVIQDNVSEIHENSYDKVELFWPLQLCQNGVEIIDSPGLNEHDIRQKVTMDYLSSVDAILFVMSCEVLASQSEISFIDNNLRSMGHEDIFFICNRINQIRSKERDSIKAHAYSKLEQRTSRQREGIFFIDALGALEGRLDGDENRVYQSGVPQLEEEIAKFLTIQKGRIKILQPARELKGTIHQARQIIPERQQLLQIDLKTLEQRYEDAQEPLKALEAERYQIVARVSNFIADTKPFVQQKAMNLYRELIDKKIEEWMKDYEIKEPVQFFKMEWMPAQVEKVVEEVKNYLAERLEKEFASWQSVELQPFVASRLESLMTELDEKAKLFAGQAQDLRFELVSGNFESKQSINYKEAQVSLRERIFAAAGGFLIGDLASGAIGAVFGFQEMLKSLIPQMAIMVGTVIFAGFNPFILIPAMTIGGIAQGVLKMHSTNDKIKQGVTQEFINQLRTNSYQISEQLSDSVIKQMSKIKDAVDQELGKEIQSIRDQVSSILVEKQKGQANVDQKLMELAVIRQNLDAIDSELDELITQVAVL